MPQVIESKITGGRLIKGSEGRIEITVYLDGTPTNTDNHPTTPTITVTRADGTALATDASTTRDSDGVYYYDLASANTGRVDTLTVAVTGTWSSDEQTFTHTLEIMGQALFLLADARSFDADDGTTGPLNDTTKYPTATVLAARDQITDLLEQWTGVSWVPRHARYDLDGSGRADLDLKHRYVNELIAASIDDVAQTVGDITITQTLGVLHHETTAWTAPTVANRLNVTVEYEHGYQGLPYDVTRIALLLLRDKLVKSDFPDSAISVAGGEKSYQLIAAGGPQKNMTRIPEVNQWIDNHTLIALA